MSGETVASNAQAKRQKRKWWQKPNNWIRAATLVFVGVYTAITLLIWGVAKDQEQRQIRAYVFLRDIKFLRNGKGSFDVIPEWENSGASETVNMHSYVSRVLTDIDMPDGFSYGDVQGAGQVPILLGPKSTTNVTFFSISKGCLDQFNRRDEITKFYIWGWDTYGDTMTDHRHITRFCWDTTEAVLSPDSQFARISYSLCREGNCADRQCPEPKPQTIQLRNTPCKPEQTPGESAK